jgi:Fe-Mn family superoxide dismutase
MIVLPPLPYAYDALVPVLSARTLTVHHDRHHARYVDAAKARAAELGLEGETLEELVRQAAARGDAGLFNNAAQAWNHAFFWNSMTPAPTRPEGRLAETIDAVFGDLQQLRDSFIAAGAGHFGSGWVWLAADGESLGVLTTHDGDTALTRRLTPLLVCDLWEHAYYLDHENDRRGFLEGWWDQLANWDFAQRQYVAAQGIGAPWTYPRGPDAYVPPIHEPTALELALEEAGLILEAQPAPGSAAGRRFDALIERIADYHAAQPEEAGQLPSTLDRRIRAAIHTAAERRPEGHWSPMVGGDLRPHPEETEPPTVA